MPELFFTLLGLLLVAILVFLNGFFVATEFALVKIRPNRVDALVEDGRTGAKYVKEATQNLDGYLAVCQLGITIASLGLGWVGEPAVAALIDPILSAVLPEGVIHIAAIAIGFGTITFLHVVFGELAPKTLSIQDAESISLVVAPPMKLFYYLFLPGIIVFNGTANYFTSLIGYPPASESEEVHTEADIRMLITQSREQGHVERDEEEMIEGVFELGDTIAREIMVPRPDVVTLDAEMSFEDLLSVVAEEDHTRYLVMDSDDGEEAVGAVHVKDVLRAVHSTDEGEEPTARNLARDVLLVPETRRIDDILAEFQSQEIQMAVVIDEWGAIEGIVTVEDIVEEIVGEIRDEFDVEKAPINRLDGGAYSIDGHTPIQTVNDALDTDFESADFETIGGMVLSQLDHAPAVDDQAMFDGYTLNVNQVDGSRITSIIARENEQGERGEKEALD